MPGSKDVFREAEAALQQLRAARPQERNPKACKGCSRTHRKCSFQQGQTRCDQCIRHDKECIFPPTPASLGGDMQRRSSDDRIPIQGAATPLRPGAQAYPRAPSRASSSNLPPLAVPSRYNQSPLHAYGQDPHYSHYSQQSPTVPSPGHYPRYPISSDHDYRHHVSSSDAFFVPSQGPLQAHDSAYGQPHWSEPQMGGGHMHVQQALDGNNYGGSFSAGVPALRGTSASSMGHGQSDASQSYARSDSAYYTQSPIHDGSPYGLEGHTMYHQPVNEPGIQYSAGGSSLGYN